MFLIVNLIIIIKPPVSQLSWLERYTDNVEVGSSSLPETTLQSSRHKRRVRKVKSKILANLIFRYKVYNKNGNI